MLIRRNCVCLIDKGLELIRKKQKYGEEYYKVIYYTYITEEQLGCCDDILDRLEEDGVILTQKTYFRRKSDAIKLLGEILFGCSEYAIKDVFELLK